MPDIALALAAAMSRAQAGGGEVSGLRQLSGGASMESWLFSFGGREMVLRRMPAGANEQDRAANVADISLAAQADLIELARKHGVTAPEVLMRLTAGDGLGAGFVMAKAEGETLPHKILGKSDFALAETRLTGQCAREMAAIHAIDPADVSPEIVQVKAADLLTKLEQGYREQNAHIPVFDYALGWLERNLPEPVEPCLVHADFRMGNLMIDADGITAVLDWELAHLGDPLEDLAYLCTPSWRFGHYEKEAGGFDSAENLIAAYQKAGGVEFDQARFDWWLIYSTLWWGVTCLRMGNSYRDGTVHTLERTVIGRRVSEVEIDLLLQFETKRNADGRTLDWDQPALLPDEGEPAYQEMLNALIEWNKDKIIPAAEGHSLFEARVAKNALGIAQRFAAWGQNFAMRQSGRFAGLGLTGSGLTSEQLCTRLRDGRADLTDEAIWDHLRLTALERLAIDQPKYAGLRVAREKWIRK